jgi:hypothetical protein
MPSPEPWLRAAQTWANPTHAGSPVDDDIDALPTLFQVGARFC